MAAAARFVMLIVCTAVGVQIERELDAHALVVGVVAAAGVRGYLAKACAIVETLDLVRARALVQHVVDAHAVREDGRLGVVRVGLGVACGAMFGQVDLILRIEDTQFKMKSHRNEIVYLVAYSFVVERIAELGVCAQQLVSHFRGISVEISEEESHIGRVACHFDELAELVELGDAVGQVAVGVFAFVVVQRVVGMKLSEKKRRHEQHDKRTNKAEECVRVCVYVRE